MQINTFFAVGADARFVANQVGTKKQDQNIVTIKRKAFDEFTDSIKNGNKEVLEG